MPNKKILFILIICLAIVSSVFIFEKAKKDKTSNELANVEVVSPNMTDSELDLKLWQETLAQINSSTTEMATKGGEVSEDKTLTGQIAKDFLAQYLILKQNNNSVSSEELKQITTNTLSVSNLDTNSVIYTEKDLIISGLSDKKTAQTYFDNIKTISKKWPVKTDVSDIVLLSDMVSTNDMSKLKEIENSVKTYRGALVGLLKTTVPTDAVQAHLHLVLSLIHI